MEMALAASQEKQFPEEEDKTYYILFYQWGDKQQLINCWEQETKAMDPCGCRLLDQKLTLCTG